MCQTDPMFLTEDVLLQFSPPPSPCLAVGGEREEGAGGGEDRGDYGRNCLPSDEMN